MKLAKIILSILIFTVSTFLWFKLGYELKQYLLIMCFLWAYGLQLSQK